MGKFGDRRAGLARGGAAMGVRLLAFTAAAGASDAVLARLDALGAEKAGRWRTHAVFLHPRNEAHGLRYADWG